MKHRVEACLKIWTAAGVTVTRRGLDLHITGLAELPSWWPEWVERNHHHLLAILPDMDAPPPPPTRRPLPEDCLPAYNVLSVSVDRVRLDKEVQFQTSYRQRLMERIQNLERLEEFARL